VPDGYAPIPVFNIRALEENVYPLLSVEGAEFRLLRFKLTKGEVQVHKRSSAVEIPRCPRFLKTVKRADSGRRRRRLTLVIRNVKDGTAGSGDGVGSVHLKVGVSCAMVNEAAHQSTQQSDFGAGS
jgi:hypothetical protein